MYSNDDDANIWWSTTSEEHFTFMAGEYVQFVGTFEDLKLAFKRLCMIHGSFKPLVT